MPSPLEGVRRARPTPGTRAGPHGGPRPGRRAVPRTVLGAGPKAAFSLLSVLVTLTLIAILAAIAVPAYFSRHDVTLDNAAVLVAHELRTAQNWAAFHGHDVTFAFEADGDGFRVLDHRGAVIERDDPKGSFSRRFSSDAVFEGVRFEAIDFGAERAVTFDARGHAARGGSVALTFSGELRTLRLAEGTGRIALEGLRRDWHDDLR